jgi:hypothetical protein
MRASRLALIGAALPLSSAVYSQDSGLVGGRIGADLSSATTQPSPSIGTQGPYERPVEPGPRAGFAGAVIPGQVVPENVLILPRQDGSGTAWVNGHQVIVGPTSSRISRVIR